MQAIDNGSDYISVIEPGVTELSVDANSFHNVTYHVESRRFSAILLAIIAFYIYDLNMFLLITYLYLSVTDYTVVIVITFFCPALPYSKHRQNQ